MPAPTDLFRPLTLLLSCALPAVLYASAVSTPGSFADKSAVLGSIDQAIAACSGSAAEDCKSTCETSRRLASSHLDKTKVNALAVENSWRSCHRAYTATLAAPPPAVDASRFAINGFSLGEDLRAKQDRFQMLQARGYVKSLRSDSTVRLRFNGAAEAGAHVPDVVLEYSGIVEQGGFTTVEAAGNGRVWKIRHVQKGAPDAAKVRAEVIARYGQPHQTQGDMLMWGCKPRNTDNCFIVEIMPHQVEYRAIDEAVKTGWAPEYQAALRLAGS